MKRIAIFGLVLCTCLLVWNVFSQEMKPSKSEENKPTKWVKVAEGVSVQKLWSDDEWPQVIVLRLSNHAYQEFIKNPARFINSYPKEFFPVMVKDPSLAGVSLTAPQEPDGYWYVLFPHGRPSSSYYAAVPEPPEKLEQSPKP